MQAWWAEDNYLKNIKNLTVQKLLTGIVHKMVEWSSLFQSSRSTLSELNRLQNRFNSLSWELKSDSLNLTCDQGASHLCTGIARVSQTLYVHRIVIATLQVAQLTVCDGAVGCAASPVVHWCQGRDRVSLSTSTILPWHSGCTQLTIQHCPDGAGCAGNYG